MYLIGLEIFIIVWVIGLFPLAPDIESKILNVKISIKKDKIKKLEEDDSVYYDKIVTVEPKKVDGQYCFVKVIIKQTGDTIVKEEILECADGRKKFDGPGYWDLFASFYYKDMKTPEYCRKYSRPNHAFKSYGTVCLDKNGEWEVKW